MTIIKIYCVVIIYLDLKYHITFRISDAEILNQTWLSCVGVAWLSFQAKLNGIFLLYEVLTRLT